MTKVILVTGSEGQLGRELQQLCNEGLSPTSWVWHFTSRKQLDITDHASILQFCIKNNINTIINAAAYNQVDKAEAEPDIADKVNHLAVRYLAQLALEHHISLIHISSDYVFDGMSAKPYRETDAMHPLNRYGKSKADGETVMQHINPPNSVIIRTSWLYSIYGNNFVSKILTLAEHQAEITVVADQYGTPTWASDLARTIITVTEKCHNNQVEVYHYSNEGTCSRYDFGKAILEYLGYHNPVRAINTDTFITAAPRPLYSALDKGKIKQALDINIPCWQDSLKRCLGSLKA